MAHDLTVWGVGTPRTMRVHWMLLELGLDYECHPIQSRTGETLTGFMTDDCPYCKGRGKVKSALTMSVEIQRKLGEILKKRSRDESDFQLRIVVHPTVLDRLRTEDEKLIIEMEKRYFGKLSFRSDPVLHAEQFKIYNAATNEELASGGG